MNPRARRLRRLRRINRYHVARLPNPWLRHETVSTYAESREAILCHPDDAAWMEAAMRGDVELAVKLRAIRRLKLALPQGEPPAWMRGGWATAFSGVNREPSGTPRTSLTADSKSGESA